MKKIALVVLTIAALACGMARRAEAAGASFTYQGVIREVDGSVPAVKNQTIEFRIYNVPTGGTALWGRSYSVLLDNTGLFNTALDGATGSPLQDVNGENLAKILADNAGTTLYIGLTVDGSAGEISPRQALLAVPYAIHAADAASASGTFTVAGKTTLGGGLEVAGDTKVANLEAASLSVAGNISASTSGMLSGYGSMPIGGIIMWSGATSNIPDGWALCDGSWSNGQKTPDLRNRFIVGAGGEYGVNATGGAKEVALTASQMPSHSHSTTFHTVGYTASFNSKQEAIAHLSNYDNKNNGNVTMSSSNAGGASPHENRPPYYALCFIMRVK